MVFRDQFVKGRSRKSKEEATVRLLNGVICRVEVYPIVNESGEDY